MMLNGGTLDGVRLLSRTTVDLMTTDHLAGKPFRAGRASGSASRSCSMLGERGIPGSVGEYGWGGAYHSTYWVDPKEELVVVYLTQIIPGDGPRRPRQAPHARVSGHHRLTTALAGKMHPLDIKERCRENEEAGIEQAQCEAAPHRRAERGLCAVSFRP